jgi:hypothetical protein
MKFKILEDYKVISEKTGKEIKPGKKVVDFRGDKAILVGVSRAPVGGSTGRIVLKYKNDGEADFYPGILDAYIMKRLKAGDRMFKLYCGGSYAVKVVKLGHASRVLVAKEDGKKFWTTQEYLAETTGIFS